MNATVAELIARIDGLLPKWRAWFPNEESMVDVPRRELLMLVEEARYATRLREAIADAGFAVVQTSGKWSIHDVSERWKADEERTAAVIAENIDLEIERDSLKAEVKRLNELVEEREQAIRDYRS